MSCFDRKAAINLEWLSWLLCHLKRVEAKDIWLECLAYLFFHCYKLCLLEKWDARDLGINHCFLWDDKTLLFWMGREGVRNSKLSLHDHHLEQGAEWNKQGCHLLSLVSQCLWQIQQLTDVWKKAYHWGEKNCLMGRLILHLLIAWLKNWFVNWLEHWFFQLNQMIGLRLILA